MTALEEAAQSLKESAERLDSAASSLAEAARGSAAESLRRADAAAEEARGSTAEDTRSRDAFDSLQKSIQNLADSQDDLVKANREAAARASRATAMYQPPQSSAVGGLTDPTRPAGPWGMPPPPAVSPVAAPTPPAAPAPSGVTPPAMPPTSPGHAPHFPLPRATSSTWWQSGHTANAQAQAAQNQPRPWFGPGGSVVGGKIGQAIGGATGAGGLVGALAPAVTAVTVFGKAVTGAGEIILGFQAKVNAFAVSMGVDKASPNTMNTFNARMDLAMAQFGTAFVNILENLSGLIDRLTKNKFFTELGEQSVRMAPIAAGLGGAYAGAKIGAAIGTALAPITGGLSILVGGGLGALAGAAAGFFGARALLANPESHGSRSLKGLPGMQLGTGESHYDALMAAAMNMGADSPETRQLKIINDNLVRIFGGQMEAVRGLRDMENPVRM